MPTPTHSRHSKPIQPPTQLLGHPEPHSPVQHRATTGPRSEFTAWLLVHPHCLLFANYPPYFLAASIPNSIGSSCNSMKSQNSIPPKPDLSVSVSPRFYVPSKSPEKNIQTLPRIIPEKAKVHQKSAGCSPFFSRLHGFPVPASMSSSSRNLRAATSLRAARSIKSWLRGDEDLKKSEECVMVKIGAWLSLGS